ncbi:arylamine N-acetyltransferase [Nocardioides kongjuensis]|uniref:Arylamine N-acetyltransferase n=1 Tax=Nocardioides kongjuensis TaxID=349522 RepID=A0A852RFQ9_9ACTN|nr:arylamine N-acetyltransferase [Nocardioides kongjuensis]
MFTDRLDPRLQQAYLDRLGVAAEPPSAAALQRIVRRHAERVPYETLWIHAGQAWDIDPHTAARRIAHERRGGYCYHLNGALGLLLTSLGYATTAHVGGVHGPDGANPTVVGNHLALSVTGLPTEDNPTGTWYVDSGLGDALHDPLPLVAGAHRQAPFDLTLEESADGTRWHLGHDPAGGFTGMSWTTGAARVEDFLAQHQRLSTSADSGFVQVAVVERRDATGVDVVRGLVPSRIGEGARTDAPVTDRGTWFALLADVFDLPLDDLTPAERDRLWSTVLAAHRRWEESQA